MPTRRPRCDSRAACLGTARRGQHRRRIRGPCPRSERTLHRSAAHRARRRTGSALRLGVGRQMGAPPLGRGTRSRGHARARGVGAHRVVDPPPAVRPRLRIWDLTTGPAKRGPSWRTGRPRHRPVPRRTDHKDPPRGRCPLPTSRVRSHPWVWSQRRSSSCRARSLLPAPAGMVRREAEQAPGLASAPRARGDGPGGYRDPSRSSVRTALSATFRKSSPSGQWRSPGAHAAARRPGASRGPGRAMDGPGTCRARARAG